MSRERKSPQQKKQLEYTKDHFTPGFQSSRMFPKMWRRKKTLANREFRRKSDEILAPAKLGLTGDDVNSISDDLTSARFEKSVSRKHLRKVGTITLGEKVKRKVERRQEAVGRNVSKHRHYDAMAKTAVLTLTSLEGEELTAVTRRADRLCNRKDRQKPTQIWSSNAPVDCALKFLYQLSCGSTFEQEALRRDPALQNLFAEWLKKADRILAKDERAKRNKQSEKDALRKSEDSSFLGCIGLRSRLGDFG
jgi:hypothetical protein